MNGVSAGQSLDRSTMDASRKSAGSVESAPIFGIQSRKIVAIEHPCIVRNLDNGLKSFGPKPDFHKLMDHSPEATPLPLWLRPENPTSRPILSNQAASNNLVLRITVPKCTGRKRKRGTNMPAFENDSADHVMRGPKVTEIASVDRRDTPESIIRKMKDNAGHYHVEAVGTIQDSHRYRALADFQFASSQFPFMNKVAKHLIPLQASKLREFRLEEGVKVGLGQEIIPPPHMTDKVIGFPYNYGQNPGIIKGEGEDEDGEARLVNRQGRKLLSLGHFIHHDTYPVPEKPRDRPSSFDTEKIPEELLEQLHEAMERRPIWTRRSLLNQISGRYTSTVLKVAIQLVGYQFRGGPWRDSIVKYGLDPRSDPKYRFYQTLSFKLSKTKIGEAKAPWQTVRKGQVKTLKTANQNSHVFDGQSYSNDGKFWQVCDLTDPFLVDMFANAPLQTECDIEGSGWYHRGTWLKVKAAMKTKMIAIDKDRLGSENDNPQKKGYIYNDYLAKRLAAYSDTSDKHVALIEVLTRPLEEFDSRKSVIQRSGLSTNDPSNEATASRSPASPGPGDVQNDLQVSDSDDAPDNAWAHIMDSDLDEEQAEAEDGNDQAEEDDDGGYESQGGDETHIGQDDGYSGSVADIEQLGKTNQRTN
ncbi:hypothetical protein F5Y15DRAFT_400313 [Xylariaceae sp. FL0016]|nr:hypothetical protein F5Y15DRAFT_400313 [Xylariaceae sp. FL0016]